MERVVNGKIDAVQCICFIQLAAPVGLKHLVGVPVLVLVLVGVLVLVLVLVGVPVLVLVLVGVLR